MARLVVFRIILALIFIISGCVIWWSAINRQYYGMDAGYSEKYTFVKQEEIYLCMPIPTTPPIAPDSRHRHKA